jgi:hypothetical protein
MVRGDMKRCPTCGRRELRSSEANRRYWAIISLFSETPIYPDGHDKPPVFYSKDNWHLLMRKMFLGCKDIELPNGETMTIPMSTASLDVSEFSDYMTKVEVWANEHDIYLPE